MRYFIIGYCLQSESNTLSFSTLGHQREDFPTYEEVRDEIKKENSSGHYLNNASILSICELTEDDYKHFWSKKN